MQAEATGIEVTSQPRTSELKRVEAERVSDHVLRSMTSFDLRILDLFLLAIVCLSFTNFLVENREFAPMALTALQISVRTLLLGALSTAVWALALSGIGLYRKDPADTIGRLCLRILIGTTLCAGTAALLLPIHPRTDSTGRNVIQFWIAGVLALSFSRFMAFPADLFARSYLRQHRRVLIVGTGPRGQKLAAQLPLDRSIAYTVVGFVDTAAQPELDSRSQEVVGGVCDLEKLLMEQQIDEVFIALPVRSSYAEIVDVIRLCERSGVRSQYLADVFDTETVKKQQTVDQRVVLHMVHSDYRLHVKRAVDVVGSLFGLVVLAPLFVVVAVFIRLESRGPVVFTQRRYGTNRRQFEILKFRSMVPDAEQLQAQLENMNEVDGPAFKIKKDPRITRVGRFIRKTSIDELPQLWNVLRGDMSLVGPRPMNMRDVSGFSELTLMRRFSVKPGMTGLWQVSGRSNTNFDRWIELDLKYIDQWSLALDTKILAKTIPTILFGEGAS